MKKYILPAIILLVSAFHTQAQKIYTKNGSISFFSKTSMENIEANNNQVMSVLNTQTGDLQFSVLIKSFHFEKALMEEHFNENCLESEKYPKATFKGSISEINKVLFGTDGMYNVNTTGELTLHGVTKKINSTGTITVRGGKIAADAKFFIKLADYNVSIPKLVKDNIAESVEVKVLMNYDQKM